MKNLSKLFKGFAKSREGSVAMMTGLTFTMVLGSVLASIEVEQIHRQQSDMQSRLDAALLFIGGSEHKTNPQEPAAAFLANSIAEAGLDVENVTPTFTYDPVTGNVTGSVEFTPRGLIGNSILRNTPLNIKAVASPKIKGRVEIAMVLDTSGSMGFSFTSDDEASAPNRRMDGLKEAAEAMFDVIYQNPNAQPAVSVVPYSDSVDITDIFASKSWGEKASQFKGADGNNLLSMVNGLTGTSLMSLNSSDVTLRDHEGETGVWAAERYESQNEDGTYEISLDAPSGDHMIPVATITAHLEDHCFPEYERRYSRYYGWYWARVGETCYDDLYQHTVSDYTETGSLYWTIGSGLKPTNGVLPMTTTAEDVEDYVASLTPNGGTAGHIGAAWGLYSLTPDWNSTFDHPAGAPAEWDETTEKYLVFMTDGVFNSPKDRSMDTDDQYAYFQSVCSAARENGVRIFTVGLLITEDDEDEEWLAQKERTEQELTACAGDTGIYFPATNRLELVDAFKGVGRETGELRISM